MAERLYCWLPMWRGNNSAWCRRKECAAWAKDKTQPEIGGCALIAAISKIPFELPGHPEEPEREEKKET